MQHFLTFSMDKDYQHFSSLDVLRVVQQASELSMNYVNAYFCFILLGCLLKRISSPFLKLPFLCIYCYRRPSRSHSINTTKVHLIPLYLYLFITYFFHKNSFSIPSRTREILQIFIGIFSFFNKLGIVVG